MKSNGIIFFRRLQMKILLFSFLLLSSLALSAQSIIIDHNCTDISKIPQEAIKKAKKQFKAAYGHTSHGSQVVSGMEALMKANALYSFNKYGTDGAFSFWDTTPKGDLGNPSRTKWADRTREFLKGYGEDRNLIIWSWGGQAANASEKDMRTYLELMTGLEKEFPNVKFVYMTGHLDGNGPNSTLSKRNEQIREYCRKNRKILFDFADIESYDPDGKVNYMQLNGWDNCDYEFDNKVRNWADEWLMKNPKHQFALPQSSAHSKPLSAALKGRAFWWMLARLAGWRPGRPSFDAIRPITQEPAAAEKVIPQNKPKINTPEKRVEKKKEEEKTYHFTQSSEYRDWMALGTNEKLEPKSISGLIIPKGGKPAVALYKKSIAAEELEFKAQIEDGTHINWYMNIDWDGSWAPSKGLGGIINNEGCILAINGEKKKIPNSPRIDNKEHHFQIVLKDGMVLWGMDGKIIAESPVPAELISRKGKTGIGAWDSKVIVSGVYLKGKE